MPAALATGICFENGIAHSQWPFSDGDKLHTRFERHISPDQMMGRQMLVLLPFGGGG